MNKKTVILIVGPTAVGKTALSVALAKRLKCDILSCDSRQFYKEMAIGTAKPTLSEMEGVKHHFVDSHNITDYYSAGDFERDAMAFLENYFIKNEVIIMTGGSGLFVQAFISGLDNMPEAPLELRKELMLRLEKEGLEKLAEELGKLDHETYNSIDLKNAQRVVRALEVCLSTGQTYSSFKTKTAKILPFEIIKIGIERPRDALYLRINARVEAMISEGLVEEVKSLTPYKNHNALQTVGYKEIFDYLEDKYSIEQAIELVKRNSRRYAKRQLTWFKNQDNFKWFQATELEKIYNFIDSKLM